MIKQKQVMSCFAGNEKTLFKVDIAIKCSGYPHKRFYMFFVKHLNDYYSQHDSLFIYILKSNDCCYSVLETSSKQGEHNRTS